MDSLRTFSVRRFGAAGSERVMDQVAAEEPLAIVVRHWQKDLQISANLAITMRTPGYDKELAVGLMLSEGVIHAPADVVELRALGNEPSNEILVDLAPGVDFEAWRLARNGFVSSSCGVCGKRSREAVQQDLPPVKTGAFQISSAVIHNLPDSLRSRQPAFAETGGLHAAALVNTTGSVEIAFEDIGRHNALDKLLGWALLNGKVPLHDHLIFMSSRGSFELVQKIAMAGAPVLATVGSPSSLAIETARDLQITLVGFVRNSRFNVYSAEWRIN
jgi:FdhD protein